MNTPTCLCQRRGAARAVLRRAVELHAQTNLVETQTRRISATLIAREK
jgi:hypothetical protein